MDDVIKSDQEWKKEASDMKEAIAAKENECLNEEGCSTEEECATEKECSKEEGCSYVSCTEVALYLTELSNVLEQFTDGIRGSLEEMLKRSEESRNKEGATNDGK
jgi:hypothetical protein